MNVLGLKAVDSSGLKTFRRVHSACAASPVIKHTRIHPSAAVASPAGLPPLAVPQVLTGRHLSPVERANPEGVASPSISRVRHLTPEDFHMYLAEAGSNVVLVDFYTDWCGPCKVMSSEFEKFGGIFKNVRFAKFNLGKHEGPFVNRLGVRGLPTFRFYLKGRMVDEVRGVRMQELRQLLVHHNRPAFALQPIHSVDEE